MTLDKSVIKLIEAHTKLKEWQVIDLYLTYHLFREGVVQ